MAHLSDSPCYAPLPCYAPSPSPRILPLPPEYNVELPGVKQGCSPPINIVIRGEGESQESRSLRCVALGKVVRTTA